MLLTDAVKVALQAPPAGPYRIAVYSDPYSKHRIRRYDEPFNLDAGVFTLRAVVIVDDQHVGQPSEPKTFIVTEPANGREMELDQISINSDTILSFPARPGSAVSDISRVQAAQLDEFEDDDAVNISVSAAGAHIIRSVMKKRIFLDPDSASLHDSPTISRHSSRTSHLSNSHSLPSSPSRSRPGSGLARPVPKQGWVDKTAM